MLVRTWRTKFRTTDPLRGSLGTRHDSRRPLARFGSPNAIDWKIELSQLKRAINVLNFFALYFRRSFYNTTRNTISLTFNALMMKIKEKSVRRQMNDNLSGKHCLWSASSSFFVAVPNCSEIPQIHFWKLFVTFQMKLFSTKTVREFFKDTPHILDFLNGKFHT